MVAKIRQAAFVGTVLCVCAVFAQDEFDFLEDEAAAGEETSTEEQVAETVAEDEAPTAASNAAEQGKRSAKPFHALVRCTRVQGEVQIMRPGASDWQNVEEGRYYPMGAIFKARRTGAVLPDLPAAEFELGKDAYVRIKEAGEFALRNAAIGEQKRTVVLRAGTIDVAMPRTMPQGAMTVAAPHFEVTNLTGESVYAYKTTADGDEAIVRVVTGTLSLRGAHYDIAEMTAADKIRIRTTGDDLETFLRGETGTYKVKIDQGIERRRNYVTNADEDVAEALDYQVTPKCAVKIFRRRSVAADRMIVSTLTFDAKGKMQNRRVFAEGLYNVNSGELVLKQHVDVAGDAASGKAEDTTALDLSEEELGEDAGDDAGGDDDAAADGGEEEDLF
ncbi:MAG: hypothetical protein IJ802_05005 [Kiritimatiellae bacterium]|nr:hypothetical protein [Kiritimatiellia bacterium]